MDGQDPTVGGEAMRARGRAEEAAQVPCPECGAQDAELRRPGWAEGLGGWLRAGGSWRPAVRVCRRCGAASSAASWGVLRPARGGWWAVPTRLVQVLRRRRTMIPAPVIYLGAAVVGAALGVAAQLALGWPWWLVAVASVAAVALFFLSTAFWGASRQGAPLATEVLRVVRPRLAEDRDRRQEVERFQAAPFPLHGLPPVRPGPRHLGGWVGSWSRGRPVTVELDLAHGDPLADEGPQLRVAVRAEHAEEGRVATVLAGSRRGLAEQLWQKAAPSARDRAEQWDRFAAARSRPDPAWSQVTIPVDGRPVVFEWLAEGRHWVARAELGDRTLTLHARDLPVASVELVRVGDLAPYVEGSRRLADARHEER